MIAVIGAGALGTALAIQIHRAGNQAALLATEYDEPVVDAYRRGDPHPAIGVPFPPAPLHARDDWPAALGDADVIVLAVSTTGLNPVTCTVSERAPIFMRPSTRPANPTVRRMSV